MSIVYPNIKTISKLKQPQTEGEHFLINFLINTLDNNYEIFYQPYLNGDRPDIIILHKNIGALIIEVKDWNLDNYQFKDGKWFVDNNGLFQILSPFEQVKKYKDNLYEIHISGLLEQKLLNKNYYSIVKTLVYFHKSSSVKVKTFLNNEFSKYDFWLCNDNLSDGFDKYLKENNFYSNFNSQLFNDKFYNEFKRNLRPPYHEIEDGIDIQFSELQKRFIDSRDEHIKIKGVPGSGKTLVLSKRAVDAVKKREEPVLILCYNITLVNYIRESINKIRAQFSWDKFHIYNYHDFINSTLINSSINYTYIIEAHLVKKYGIYLNPKLKFDESINDLRKKKGDKFIDEVFEEAVYSNIDLFEYIKDDILKYRSIFIDEGQDFLYSWFKIIKNYFLNDNSEYVIIGDAKQNVYHRKLDAFRSSVTNIRGQWNNLNLNESYRLNIRISDILYEFQKTYLNNKYYIDKITINSNQTNIFQEYKEGTIQYYNIQDIGFEETCDIIIGLLKDNDINPSDVVILGESINYLVDIDYKYRMKTKSKSISTFETFEFKKELETNLGVNNSKELEMKLKSIRKYKKKYFYNKSGLIKFSTIHSFKGWESPTVIIFIDDKEIANYELIYTAISRARHNLFILNKSTNVYSKFFKSRCDNY